MNMNANIKIKTFVLFLVAGLCGLVMQAAEYSDANFK